jgi:putative endonuclease
MSWCVYILICSDGTLYTGISNDLAKRLAAHNRGTASKYTRVRRPVEVACAFPAADRSQASRWEAKVKKLTRKQKVELVHAILLAQSLHLVWRRGDE